MNTELEQGYYWVKRNPETNWEVAYLGKRGYASYWWLGAEMVSFQFFPIINETRIEPPNN